MPGSARRASNRSLAIGLLSMVLSASSASSSQRLSSHDAEVGRRAAELFRAYDAPGQPGCAVGVARRGEVVHLSGHGVANVGREEAIDADTIFNIASTSKQFTAFSILLLESRGKLSLEDSVSKYLPELAHYAGPIKIKHLLWHTSGVRDYYTILTLGGRTREDAVVESDTLQALARQRALNSQPGTEYDYSNSGYFLMAQVVERVSGRPFAAFVKANIFDPLGMTSSTIGKPKHPRLALGYGPQADGSFQSQPAQWEQTGESNLHTTVSDLLRWAENFRSAKVGGKQVIERMQRVGALDSGKRLDYASGLMIDTYRGLPRVSHSGYSVGYRAQLLRFPKQQLAIAVLCNRLDAEVEQEAERIADIYLAGKLGERALSADVDAMRAPNTIALALAPEGAYRNPRTGAYVRLVRTPDGVMLQAGEQRAPLQQVRDNLYAAQLEGNARYVAALASEAAKSPRLLVRFHSKPAEYELVETWAPTDLARYAGTYYSDELDATYRLAVRDGALLLDMKGTAQTLRPGARGEFEGNGWRSVRVSEQADHFTFGIPELRGIRFNRVPDAQPFESARQFIQKVLSDTPTPSVAVAVARDGRILWEEGFGWADRERRIPATAHTMYSLASASKPITATGLMTLVREGKVDLDRPANDYLGAAKLVARVGDAKDATVRRLANHSSGLGRHFQYFLADERWRRPAMDVTIRRYGNLVTLPGERYTYSNLNTSLLDYIVTRQSGTDFASYMQREVFQPLGMSESAVNTGGAPEQRWAVRYDEFNQPLPPYISDTPGAADIYSSAHDLARFGLFHLKQPLQDQTRILPDALIDAMHEPGTRVSEDRSYGLGWHMQERCDGYRSVYHGGGLAGSSTVVMLVPKERLTVVVLINRFSRGDSRDLVPEITNQIVRTLLPKWRACDDGSRVAPAVQQLPADFVGVWSGRVHTEQANLPLKLRFLPSGEVHASLAGQDEVMLTDVRLANGWLQGSMSGAIKTTDAARYGENTLDFTLKMRAGGVLNGSVTAGSQHERPGIGGMTMTLAHWVELRRQP